MPKCLCGKEMEFVMNGQRYQLYQCACGRLMMRPLCGDIRRYYTPEERIEKGRETKKDSKGQAPITNIKMKLPKVAIGAYVTREQIRAALLKDNPGIEEVHFERYHTWLTCKVPNSKLYDLIWYSPVVPQKGWKRTDKGYVVLAVDVESSSWEE